MGAHVVQDPGVRVDDGHAAEHHPEAEHAHAHQFNDLVRVEDDARDDHAARGRLRARRAVALLRADQRLLQRLGLGARALGGDLLAVGLDAQLVAVAHVDEPDEEQAEPGRAGPGRPLDAAEPELQRHDCRDEREGCDALGRDGLPALDRVTATTYDEMGCPNSIECLFPSDMTDDVTVQRRHSSAIARFVFTELASARATGPSGRLPASRGPGLDARAATTFARPRKPSPARTPRASSDGASRPARRRSPETTALRPPPITPTTRR